MFTQDTGRRSVRLPALQGWVNVLVMVSMAKPPFLQGYITGYYQYHCRQHSVGHTHCDQISHVYLHQGTLIVVNFFVRP